MDDLTVLAISAAVLILAAVIYRLISRLYVTWWEKPVKANQPPGQDG